MRLNHSNFLFLLSSVLLVQTVHSSPPGAAKKKLIEFGWDEPDTAFMREHVAEMERTPFDGCVFHVDYPKPSGGKGSFIWEGWGTRAFTAPELTEEHPPPRRGG